MLIEEYPHKEQNIDWKILFFICALSLVIVYLHVTSLPENAYLWTMDSSYYIEAARSFVKTGEFLVSPSLLSEKNQETLKLWPPGYPVLIALFSVITGLSTEAASYGIAIVSWFLLAPVVVYAVIPVVERRAAIWVAFLVSLSPGVITLGCRGLSDLPFLVIAVFSFGFLVRSYNGRNYLAYAFSAGLFAGLAYTIRNVGLAILMASIAAYAAVAILGSLQKKKAAARFFTFCFGAMFFLLPLIYFNLKTFGTIKPYSMSSSTISLMVNARSFIQASILDVSGLAAFAHFIAWTWWAITLFLGLILLFGAITIKQIVANSATHSESTWNQKRGFAMVALLLYVLSGAAIVIVARTVYEWGEMITARHILQYTWALLTVLFAVTSMLSNGRKASFTVLVLGVSLMLGHAHWAWEHDWSKQIPNQRTEIYNNDSLAKRLIELPSDSILVSNYADVLRIKTQQTVRQIYPRETNKIMAKLAELKGSRLWDKSITVILFAYPDGEVFSQSQINDYSSLGFSVELINESALILIKSA